MSRPYQSSEQIILAGAQRVKWLRPPIYLCCVLAFATDVYDTIQLSFGLFYVPLVCTAVFHRSRNAVWWLAFLSTVMITLGFFFPSISPNMGLSVANRALSVIGIFITAFLVRQFLNVQDRLIEQTERAEAAEEVKSMVFTNLTQGIQGPLHAMVSVTGLMQANCRPDQRPPLVEIHSSARRLLSTIENLIDLTQLDQRRTRTETVDVGHLVRQTVAGFRPRATERQVSVDLSLPPGPPVTAQSDAWAVRRILENLLSNAIKFSPPGATVIVTTEVGPASVTALVHDDGEGMSADDADQLSTPSHDPIFMETDGTGTGTGLALSRRLASVIGAELTFNSQPGIGTTAALRLRRQGVT